ncbi:tRNA (guanosine(46)-N7)-methyltransferase TrmB [Ruminococcus sp. NK3A76]|uniref:tRNA (guanosine(46)-N7)-methyltransferase TrmB n=1 Tax=Ruminococcus sp. NK3A76 TaxID=877411 RepID=UPI00049069A8|nr:tRNA (guanosine(46)-N7)-methyltransferase TrmB [Ruminococcus sp. NK3A76]
MRMRRKKHLEERLEACGDKIIFMDRDDRNFEVKTTESILDLKSLFGNDNPIHMEIGCGKGKFVCDIARQNPDINYLAVEKASNVIVDAAEKAIGLGIQNVIFLRGGAEYLDSYIPQHSIGRIYLNFSCPFPKKSYASHRLTHHRFLEIYKRIMLPEAEIHQKTDNMQLFEFSIEQFSHSGFGIKNVSLDLHKSSFEGNIMTEYETRFAELGQPIYRLEAEILK